MLAWVSVGENAENSLAKSNDDWLIASAEVRREETVQEVIKRKG